MSDSAAGRQTAGEVYQELNDLLDVFCSEAQQRFCAEQQVCSAPQLQRIRQTMQQVQRFVPVVGLLGGPNGQSLRTTLERTALEMAEYYEIACRQRRIRANLSEEQIHELIGSWHELSQQYDDKSREHAVLTRLLDDCTFLRKAWKRPEQVENIMSSILASYGTRPGTYVVTVDRQNYAQLGLKRRALGSRQIVFECSRLSRSQQIDAIAELCHRFASVFMQNAHHNLSQIDGQARLARPTLLARLLRRLYERVFTVEVEVDSSGSSSNDDDDDADNYHRHRRLSIDQDAHLSSGNNHIVVRRRKISQGPRPFRLTTATTTPSLIWYPTRSANEFPIVSMPTPVFVPAPWQWADLLKPRRPYHPLLFGLFKRRRQSRSNTSSSNSLGTRFLHSAGANANDDDTTDETAEPPSSLAVDPGTHTTATSAAAPHNNAAHQAAAAAGASAETLGDTKDEDFEENFDQHTWPFATVSVTSLCSHLCRIGHQFYQDVLNNAQFRYHQDSRVLQGIGQDLVQIYMSLQLESSRTSMHRVLALVEQLAIMDPGFSSSFVPHQSSAPPSQHRPHSHRPRSASDHPPLHEPDTTDSVAAPPQSPSTPPPAHSPPEAATAAAVSSTTATSITERPSSTMHA